ncbi:phosphatase PAP2 family protein [Clostridia bacterium]|nr:phosphatase PAP2 family protein [Clostridia bacterium]
MNKELELMRFIYENLRAPWLDNTMIFFSEIAELAMVWYLAGMVLLCLKKYRKHGIALIISVSIAFLCGEFIIKNIICRVRPCFLVEGIKLIYNIPKSYSFPSGHASTSFTAAMVLLKTNKKSGIFAFIVATLIGISRVYLFVHFPTDVLAGVILGILIAQITTRIFSV